VRSCLGRRAVAVALQQPLAVRILNVTVLVASIDKTRIPVSCVEQGRWSVRSPFFEPARHTAYPELRRRKAERLCADPLSLGVAQNVVWDAVQEKADRRDVYSMTGAQAGGHRFDPGTLHSSNTTEPRSQTGFAAPELLAILSARIR
jgi:hypothetical protein